jgi:hypothetical protein
MAGDPLPPAMHKWQRPPAADQSWLGCLIIVLVMACCAILFLSVLR